MDNWGWCTGECRDTNANGVITDNSSSKIQHRFGGCFAGANNDPEAANSDGQINVNISTSERLLSNGGNRENQNECAVELPTNDSPSGLTKRPWVVYPGSVQLRPGN